MENNIGTAENWFQLKWFVPELLGSYSWQYAIVLWGLLLIPVIFILNWLIYYGRSHKMEIALPESKQASDPIALFRFLPPIVLSGAFALLIVALARPQKSNEQVEQWTEGIDIMLAVDISESMTLMDFKPNRLEAAKDVARDFVSGRFQDRIGLVIFSGEAYSLAPLTTDYELLKYYIDEITFDQIQKRGTAIGSALAVSINRMRESDSKSKVIILLSDGENTAGNIDPITAAELANAFGIKIYTIAIGKEGKVPMSTGVFGQTRYIENNLDETTLRDIAKIGEGKFYRATNNKALEKIFATIDQYEKAEIKETRFKNTTDYYVVYLKWAILLFLLWLMTKSTFLSNVLQD